MQAALPPMKRSPSRDRPRLAGRIERLSKSPLYQTASFEAERVKKPVSQGRSQANANYDIDAIRKS